MLIARKLFAAVAAVLVVCVLYFVGMRLTERKKSPSTHSHDQ